MKTANRIATVGESILIVKPTIGSDYSKGDTFTVYETYDDLVEVEEHAQDVFHSEYVVIQNV